MIVVIPTIVLCVFSGRKHTERVWNTVKPLNKGHIGKSINSAVVSFAERLSSSQRVQLFGALKSVLCREVYLLRPYLGESTILEVLLYCKLLNETMGYQKALQQ